MDALWWTIEEMRENAFLIMIQHNIQQILEIQISCLYFCFFLICKIFFK